MHELRWSSSWPAHRCVLTPMLTALISSAAPSPPQLNDWFLASRDPETGEYADLPAADKGGSRAIIHPPPPQPTAEEAAAAAAKAGKAGAAAGKSSSTGKPGGGKGKAAAGEEAPRCSQAFLEGLQAAMQQYMDVWQEYEPSDPAAALRERAAAVPWRMASNAEGGTRGACTAAAHYLSPVRSTSSSFHGLPCSQQLCTGALGATQS